MIIIIIIIIIIYNWDCSGETTSGSEKNRKTRRDTKWAGGERKRTKCMGKQFEQMLEEWFIAGWGAAYNVGRQEKCGTKSEDKERGWVTQWEVLIEQGDTMCWVRRSINYTEGKDIPLRRSCFYLLKSSYAAQPFSKQSVYPACVTWHYTLESW